MLKTTKKQEADIVAPAESPDDKSLDITLRPLKLADFIGQKKAAAAVIKTNPLFDPQEPH